MSEDNKEEINNKDYKPVNNNDVSVIPTFKAELAKIKNSSSEGEEMIIDPNPVSQYNFFVKNYNLSYNKIMNQELLEINYENVFKRLYWFQSRWWTYVLFNLLIPSIIVIINNFVVVKAAWGTIIVIHYLVISIINVGSYYISEEARLIFMKNKIKVPNPFERMIFNPTICKNYNVNNDHFEVDKESLEMFNLDPQQVEKLEISGDKYKFMVYDSDFIEYYATINKDSEFYLNLFWLISSFFLMVLYFALIFGR